MKSITVLRLNKILRKASALMAVLCLVTMLCGCSAGFFSGDLLTSPRLTDEQTEIYNALTASAGRVDLRYPHTGSYRSAFVIRNIDNEPTDEAIVFYEQNKTDAAKEPAQQRMMQESPITSPARQVLPPSRTVTALSPFSPAILPFG